MSVLEGLLRAAEADRVLVIDRQPDHWSAQAAPALTLLDAEAALERLPEQGRYDFALLVNVLDALPRRRAEQLLARLRDVHCSHFLVALPADTAWQANDLYAFGLHALPEASARCPALVLYGYDLYDYKKTPDWLNPDHWANPQLWDQYRW